MMRTAAKCIYVLLCLNFELLVHSDNLQQRCGPPSDAIQFDWETFDYYAVLGLPAPALEDSRDKRRKDRESIDSHQIRKSYRKQAQIHHPDKVCRDDRNSTSKLEESNKRFARISEAYEVLNDSEKRQEYDNWLLDCEDYIRDKSNPQLKGESWSVFDSFSDPRRVFDDFFFHFQRDDTGNKWRGRSSGSPQQPARVEESRETFYDPYSGQEIIRIYRTEEFEANQEGLCFYRVIVQDYAQKYDRFYGLEFHPISSAAVVEEGYREKPETFDDARKSSNTLFPDEFLIQQSKPLLSTNGLFYAGLTPDCDMIVVSSFNSGDDADEAIIWSAGTFVPPSVAQCFLSLQGPYLVLALGTPDTPGQILWNNDVPNSFLADENSNRKHQRKALSYFVQLDDDGSLVVYARRPALGEEDNVPPGSAHFHPSHTRAARAWRGIRRWFKRKILKSSNEDLKGTNTNHSMVKINIICIFASGPVGCNPFLRKILHVAQGVRVGVKRTIIKIDATFDSMVQLILDADDDDALDTITRIIGNVAAFFLKVGSTLAKKGINLVKNYIG